MRKKPLQITTFVLGLIPLITGLIHLLGIDDPLYASAGLPRFALLDSNLRFFGGVWFGLGLAIVWLVRDIEKAPQVLLFRVIWGMIFLGGIGRLLSMVFVGLPPLAFIGFTLLEIVGAPLFVYWHSRVVRQSGAVGDGQA